MLAALRHGPAQLRDVRPLLSPGQLGVGHVRGVENRLEREQRERRERAAVLGRQLGVPERASFLQLRVRALERAQLGQRLLVARLRGALARGRDASRRCSDRRARARTRSPRGRAPDRRRPSRAARRRRRTRARRARSASVSRMFARNWLPSPSPCDAPFTSPAMSTNSTTAGTMRSGLHDAREHVEPRVGDVDAADVRILRRERIVGGQHAGRRERVEESGLADVRQSDDSEF